MHVTVTNQLLESRGLCRSTQQLNIEISEGKKTTIVVTSYHSDILIFIFNKKFSCNIEMCPAD